ncbi:hypothetical protein LL998_04605 [Burkholderia ambifaria]|uniref:hypothetical protein n=1 Tax=Burkholderia ambifaria TaxID=152480 RepID=UPI001E29A552|nr:hypothetical protein [Burkholderia ambifaria]UEP35583.1 hypothetical protein LL998_04605 [Burkholderia ambifaria]
MADAAHAELYAESRRDGNAAGRSACGVGPHRIRAFHDFHTAAAIDISGALRRPLQTKSNAD